MTRILRGLLAALLCCALLMPAMGAALGESDGEFTERTEAAAPTGIENAGEVDGIAADVADDEAMQLIGDAGILDEEAAFAGDEDDLALAPDDAVPVAESEAEAAEAMEISLDEAMAPEAAAEPTAVSGRPSIRADGGVALTFDYFPDGSFLSYLTRLLGVPQGSRLTDDQIASVKEIDLRNNPAFVTDLTGVEYFTSLEVLDTRYTGETYGDETFIPNLSGLTRIRALRIPGTRLGWKLNPTAFPDLEELDCSDVEYYTTDDWDDGEKLGTLDVSNCPKLERLACQNCGLRQLDVGANRNLRVLDCGYNYGLSGLNMRNNPALVELRCLETGLTGLDVSANPMLETLDCMCCELTALSVGGNPALRELYCTGNALGTLDLSGNADLEVLNCADCCLTSLDIRQNPLLYRLNCASNGIDRLDVRDNPLLNALGLVKYDAKNWEYHSFQRRISADLFHMLEYDFSTILLRSANAISDATVQKSATITVNKGDVRYIHVNRYAKKTIRNTNTKVASATIKGKALAVSAKAVGKTSVTFTTSEGKTIVLTVKVVNPASPRSVSLDQTAVKLRAGQKANFRLTSILRWYDDPLGRARNEAVTWTSSDRTVAKVSSTGLVTPQKPGKATITVKTANGKKATCLVTITKNRIDRIHAAPTASQIRKLAKTHPRGFLKSVEIVNSNKIVLEWYLMNGRNKALKKTPTMEMYVRYAKETIAPNDGEGAEGREGEEEYEENYEYICLTDYDYKTVNVPANSYKIIKVTLTPSNTYEFKADMKLSTVKSKLDWAFEWVGE